MGNDYIYLDDRAFAMTENTSGRPWVTTITSWGEPDPLMARCQHERPRFLRRPLACNRPLWEHMERDFGHTFVASTDTEDK